MVYSEGLDGRHVEKSMHQLSKEEKWGYVQEDRAFIDALTAGTPAAVSAADTFKSVQLVDAVYQSVKESKLILISVSE